MVKFLRRTCGSTKAESRCEARRAAMLEQFDADGDGELNEEETSALREYLREWVRGEHLGEERPF